jgi:DNA-binding beta-propeller fold protein YncE
VAAFSGPLRTSAATLSYDRKHRELYVVSDGLVRVVNESGMEVYTWPQDEELGSVLGVAALDDGDVVALHYRGADLVLVLCNYRGEPVGEVPIEGLARFRATHLAYRDGKLYLANLGDARTVAVVDLAARHVVRTVDLVKALKFEGAQVGYGVDSFAVDRNGNLLFTVAPAFKVYVLSPEGELRAFGRSGSAPGKFGIIRGVAIDDDGRIYVTDALKSAVLAFDADFRFLAEFGYRGNRPGNLLGPRDVVFADGKLYVSQQARRGVAVFAVAPQ